MLALLRRLFRRTPAPPPAPALPAPRAVPTLIAPTLEAPPPDDAAPDPVAAARLRYAALLRQRVTRLGLDHALASPDCDRVLDALVASPLEAVRQLPSAAAAAMAVCQREDATWADLTRVCEHDPTLAQALLRYANSAWYLRGGQRPAVSIREAVARVGAQGVRNVVLDVALHGMRSDPGSGLTAVAELVWAHMVRTAPVARAVAPAFGVEAEPCWSLGLLHDIGKLVWMDQVSALRARLRRELALPAPFVAASLRELHEPLGALAALRWNLGVEVADAIGQHHRTPLPTAPDVLGEVLYLAERADLARLRGEPLDLAAVWTAGELGGDQAAAAQALTLHDPALAPAAAAAAA